MLSEFLAARLSATPLRNFGLDVPTERLRDRPVPEQPPVLRPRLVIDPDPEPSATPASPVHSRRSPVVFHVCPYLLCRITSEPPPTDFEAATESSIETGTHLHPGAQVNTCTRWSDGHRFISARLVRRAERASVRGSYVDRQEGLVPAARSASAITGR